MNGYDLDGYDCNGRDEKGFDREGYDREGFDSDGYDRERYSRKGWNKFWINRQGFMPDGSRAPQYLLDKMLADEVAYTQHKLVLAKKAFQAAKNKQSSQLTQLSLSSFKASAASSSSSSSKPSASSSSSSSTSSSSKPCGSSSSSTSASKSSSNLASSRSRSKSKKARRSQSYDSDNDQVMSDTSATSLQSTQSVPEAVIRSSKRSLFKLSQVENLVEDEFKNQMNNIQQHFFPEAVKQILNSTSSKDGVIFIKRINEYIGMKQLQDRINGTTLINYDKKLTPYVNRMILDICRNGYYSNRLLAKGAVEQYAGIFCFLRIFAVCS